MKRPPGSLLSQALKTATPHAHRQAAEMASSKAAADRTMLQRLGDRARAAAGAVADAARAAGRATVDAGKAVAGAAVAATDWTVERAKDTVAIANTAHVVNIGAILFIASMAERAAMAPFNALHRTFGDGPCFECEAKDSAGQRAARIRNREALMTMAEASGDPELDRLAALLRQDMEGVELARLSQDVYNGWPNSEKPRVEPPQPWSAASPVQLAAMGIRQSDLDTAKARVYLLPEGFPGGPRTVLAFRGTTADPEDLLSNHDQALGLGAQQYSAATRLGRQLGRARAQGKAPGAAVTGHSLGGGKAQAAGFAGGLPGMMHNASGVLPETVAPRPVSAADTRFVQYRSPADPLNSLQGSLDLQYAVMAALTPVARVVGTGPGKRLAKWKVIKGDNDMARLFDRVIGQHPGADGTPQSTLDLARENKRKHGYFIPPAQGKSDIVTPLKPDGSSVGTLDAGGQHSIVNLVNGIEQRKYETIDTLRAGLGNPGRQSDFIAGPGAGLIGTVKHVLN